jgi:hypothetical protein
MNGKVGAPTEGLSAASRPVHGMEQSGGAPWAASWHPKWKNGPEPVGRRRNGESGSRRRRHAPMSAPESGRSPELPRSRVVANATLVQNLGRA